MHAHSGRAADGPAAGTDPVGSGGGRLTWPVRSGAVPPLADGFISRSETAPGLGAALVPGAALLLVNGHMTAEGPVDWLRSCGKTQLAVYLAESLWQSRGVDMLVWITATSRACVLSGYVAAAEAMGTDLVGDAELIAARFLSWLGETDRTWLVVFDDLSDPADLEGLWPQGPAGRVVVTTTAATELADAHRMQVLPIGVFSPREALNYVMGRLTANRDQRLGAIDLLEDLGRSALALAQATTMIASSGVSCRDYREHFAHRREQLAGAGGKPSAVEVTWMLSAEHADRLSPGGVAQYLLVIGALLDGNAIPGAVFTSQAACEYLAREGAESSADPKGAWGALLSLERAGLLAIDPAGTPPTVRMSPVVQAAVRSAFPAGRLDRAVTAAADALLEVWPDDKSRPWSAQPLRSCAASLQQAAGDRLWLSGCHPVLLRAGRSLDSARLTRPAVLYWQELAAVSDRLLGPGNPDARLAGIQLAGALLTAGQAAEAVPWFQWVLDGRTRAFGADHPGTVAVRVSLGRAFVEAGQPRDAVSVLEQAVGDFERVRGTNHLDTVGARNELAAACSAAGQLTDSIRLYRRTLADRERIQGPQHPDTMTTRQQLAAVYLTEGRIKDAVTAYKRVQIDRERVLGPDHPDTIAACADLGSAYHSAGRMASALRLHEQACTDSARVLGADHPSTLARRASLAHAYYKVGRLTDATTVLRDTVARCEQVLPPGDALTVAARESLTNIAGE
jgi:tetratricopeptide (TPR) repeat protein